MIDYLPYDVLAEDLEPIFEARAGWKEDLTRLGSIDEIPKELESYINYLEAELETPITIVSVGPDRTQTLTRNVASV